jgi:pSer/pThr/pTyr-binding forkhead associated (FHA) protein
MSDLPFEWTMLLLRVVFIFFLYFFVFQVIRVLSRELRAAASAGQQPADVQRGAGSLLVSEPGDSNLRRGEVFDLEPVTVIGRHPRATIVVDSTFVSSEHAQLSWEQDRWWVTDLRSTNGTMVNGAAIRVPTGLRSGDVIELGAIRFQLVP